MTIKWIPDNQIEINLIKGIAHLYALKTLKTEPKENNITKEKPVSTQAIINIEFVRLDILLSAYLKRA